MKVTNKSNTDRFICTDYYSTYGLWGLQGAIKHSYYQKQKKSNVQIATHQNVRNY